MTMRVNGRSRGVKVGIAAVAMAALLGACGSSSPSATPKVKKLSGSDIVLASVQTTAAAKTAKVSMSIGTAGSKSFSLKADGAVDFSNGNTEMTMDLGGMLASFLPGGLEVRAVDGVSYVKLPDSLGKFLGGSGDAKWFSMPTGKAGAGANPLSGAGQSDPTKFLAALENISDEVKEVGTETVRGVATKHYTATLNLGKAIDKSDVPPALRDKVKGLLAKNGKASTIPVDVWVDGDGYLRRMTMNLDSGTLGGFGGATGVSGAIPTISVSIEFYDFGAPVNVQAPPADQIISAKDFGQIGGGMFGGLSGPADLGSGSGSVTG